MPKESYHHGDLKTELIKKGLTLLDQEGYAGFSLRKVAKACNVSQTAPYRHFKDKDELIGAIAVEAFRAFGDILEQAVKNNPDNPRKKLKDMGVAYVSFFANNPEYLRMLFLNDLKLEMCYKISNPDYSSESMRPFMTLVKAVESFKAAYGIDTLTEEELILYCWGLVHGIAVLYTSGQFQFSKDDFIRMVSNVIESSVFL